MVLVLGIAVAVAAAFGPDWVIRAGVGALVITAVVACACAWNEVSQARQEHSAAMIAAARNHGKALTEERRHNSTVVDTLTDRAKNAAGEAERLRVDRVQLQRVIASLHGDKAALKAELALRENTIAGLRELIEAPAAKTEGEAEVLGLPRRVKTEHESLWDSLPQADELWSDGDHPTVIDLKAVAAMIELVEAEERAERELPEHKQAM
ncbi:hypothetical protein [Microlunatus sp. GCM10028923]|uniref:hypothetical protein n=1 Tax=Microlunatus sp. GCM10028923 TaxID=3273400 RepID=UPI00361B3F3B